MVDCDSVFALHLHLLENGAGNVNIADIVGLPQNRPPDPTLLGDSALASKLADEELTLTSDLVMAKSLAAKEVGLLTPASTRPEQVSRNVRLVSQSVPPVGCPICTELVPAAACFRASPCGHRFCTTCMQAHLTVVATQTHVFPLRCPTCNGDMNSDECLKLLAGSGRAYLALQNLILEREHHPQIRYCSNTACALPFDWFDDPRLHRNVDRYCVECPMCEHQTCVNCKTEWHEGETCEQARACKEREGDAALDRLARANMWRACPRCGYVIEKQQGDCNFVKCRCGCGFCYGCGKAYISLQRTVRNEHGQAGCSCALFDARGDDAEAGAPIDVVADRRLGNGVAAEMLPRAFLRPPLLENWLRRIHDDDDDDDDDDNDNDNDYDDDDDNDYDDDDEGDDDDEDEDGSWDEGRVRGDVDQHLDVGAKGHNGSVRLSRWVGSHRLSDRMEDKLRANECPYDNCSAVFATRHRLEQHLANVQRHAVFLCCERPFMSQHALDAHAAALHH